MSVRSVYWAAAKDAWRKGARRWALRLFWRGLKPP